MNCLRRHTCWQSRGLYWEEAPGWSTGGWGNPGGLLCHLSSSIRFHGDGVSFQVVSGQSFWLRVLPDGTSIAQPRWTPVRRILGGGRACGVSFWPFPNSSSWWWLVSPVFFTRTSCHKTHANREYGAWPEWAVSVRVSPNSTHPPHPCPMHEGFWVSTFPLPPDMIQLSDFCLSSRCYKEGWALRIDAFKLWCWRRLLRVPWRARRSNQSILKEINPEYLLAVLMLKLQYFGTWGEEPTHWKRPWCWERLRAGGEGDDRGWDVWMASPIQWTWIWANPGRWWRTGEPSVLQSMGLQRVRYNLVTEQQLGTKWSLIVFFPPFLLWKISNV